MFQCSDHTANIRLVKTFSRHLGQDEYIPFRITSSKEVLVKTLVLAIPVKYIFKTSSNRLAKTSSRRFQDVSKTSCQNVFKTSSRRFVKGSSRCLAKSSSRYLQDVFETSLRHLQDVLQRYLQDVFNTYHQVKLFLLTRLWKAFNTFLRRSFPKTIIYRGICPGNTTSDKFMVSVQNLQER